MDYLRPHGKRTTNIDFSGSNVLLEITVYPIHIIYEGSLPNLNTATDNADIGLST